MEERLHSILTDADRLLEVCGNEFQDDTEYQLLLRCLSEQTIVEKAARHLRTKEEGSFHSGIHQNPSDPDTTYRTKSGMLN